MKDEKIYLKVFNYEELLEYISQGDYPFYYKGVPYVITYEGGPAVKRISWKINKNGEKLAVYGDNVKTYKTYDELMQDFVLDDGTPIIEAFKSDYMGAF